MKKQIINHNQLLYGVLFLLICLFSFSEKEIESNQDYFLQPGDVLVIHVLGEEDMEREVRVSAKGKISYPLIGEVDVSKKASTEVEKLLTELLKEYLIDPQVSVFISQFAKIFVLGEVQNPGSFELKKRISLLESITLAGGFTQYANERKVKIIRKSEFEEKTIIVDLQEVTEKGNKEKDTILQPGDIVFVPERFL